MVSRGYKTGNCRRWESAIGGLFMEVTMQSLILSVVDLDRAREFFTEVFGFPLITQRKDVAVLEVNEQGRSQVLVLRGNPRAAHPGRGTIGARVIGFEVASAEELRQIEERLK